MEIYISIKINAGSDKIKHGGQNNDQQNNKFKNKKLHSDQQRSKEIYAKHRACLDKIKEDCGCAICGTNTKRLLFHHTEPTHKNFNITTAKHKTDNEIIDEINKCVVLCYGCHNKLHHSRPKALYRTSAETQT